LNIRRALAVLLRFCGGFLAAVVFALIVYRFAPVHQTSLMGLRHIQGQELRQDWVRIEQISDELVLAVIAAEDNKFCRHIGFDFGEMKAAWEDAKRGEGLRGASTISQQTVKNVFLWPGRGPVRKLAEAGLTFPFELLYSKRRIMELYLNVAEWGDGIFGAEAAAQARFGKPATELTAREAALLAAVLPSPNKWRDDPPGPYVRKRSSQLQTRMRTVDGEGFASCVLR
jgi:monofunctional biosynthetic peptidoglycan transglycosylase